MVLSSQRMQVCAKKRQVIFERRIRDLNDEINKLIREKGHWEVRIVELGGPDYAKVNCK